MHACMQPLVWFGLAFGAQVRRRWAGRNFREGAPHALWPLLAFRSTGFRSFPKRIALFIGPPPCRECTSPRILVCVTRSTSIDHLILCIYLSFACLLHYQSKLHPWLCVHLLLPWNSYWLRWLQHSSSNRIFIGKKQITSKCLDQIVHTFF